MFFLALHSPPQDSVQGWVLHLVVMIFWSPLVWNTFIAFRCLLWHWHLRNRVPPPIHAPFFLKIEQSSCSVCLMFLGDFTGVVHCWPWCCTGEVVSFMGSCVRRHTLLTGGGNSDLCYIIIRFYFLPWIHKQFMRHFNTYKCSAPYQNLPLDWKSMGASCWSTLHSVAVQW